MFLKRFFKSIIGFITCTAVVVLLLYIIWPTIDMVELLALNDNMKADHGTGGHFWVILLMLLVVNMFLKIGIPLPDILSSYSIDNQFGNPRMYILIIFIWLVGSFAGGLASRGGLRSGAWSSILSFLFLDFIFATMTASMGLSFLGLSGFTLFIVTFLATLVLGSFIFIPIIGLVGGITGGILGKMLFRKEKKSKDQEEE
ncbi:MAG: hypothetical protein H7641_14510 [Candidatus Heimdallarchaeota archaeon]|nr:hypothetical protein [Candidatus Heimdallarchaeota archaeon]MCK4878774.1 hypothetical protein [Candidatus Heimdallarchaeota archaeon]